jgi:uncharacterized repeat protein (TIGR03803 family)
MMKLQRTANLPSSATTSRQPNRSTVWLAFAIAIALVAPASSAQAQTFQVIHNFTGGLDGSSPSAALTIDRAGHIYGVSGYGATGDHGAVFELKHLGSGWTLSPIYEFLGENDGSNPQGGLVFGPEGLLYGTTVGGGSTGAGTIYALQPPASACKTAICFWSETTLHSFGSGTDGMYPLSSLVSDQAGNFYGTAWFGGSNGDGTVFELTKSGSSWSENTLYSFVGPPNDGSQPESAVIFDTAGNLYGTTSNGGTNSDGTAFELTPSNGGWSESVLYNFSNNAVGFLPVGGFVMDQEGNLYGTTYINGSIFELTHSNGQWNATSLYTAPQFSSYAALTIDQAGNLYGVSDVGSNGGNDFGDGFVFKLTKSNGTWTLTDLHDFDGSDGKEPDGPVTLDAAGNLWGTTFGGGQGCGGGCGVVWEITAQ